MWYETFHRRQRFLFHKCKWNDLLEGFSLNLVIINGDEEFSKESVRHFIDLRSFTSTAIIYASKNLLTDL